MMKPVQIGPHLIGPGQPVYIIAEAGANHEGDLETAEKMIVEARRANIQCIKFQTYKAEKLVTRTAPMYWLDTDHRASNQFEMFTGLDGFDEPEWRQLIAKADEVGITFMSSAWDEDSVDMLDELGMTAFKVGSADITSLPLLSHIARKGKPMILSTGASTVGEIDVALQCIREEGNEDIILLHCILTYPTNYVDTNLQMMVWLQEVYPDLPVGYSDHTLADPSMTVPIAAAAMGARVIEKHFTLDKTMPGNDHYLSMDPSDLVKWKESLDILHQVKKESGQRIVLPTEEKPREMARRSLVSQVAIPKDTVVTREMLTYKRPGLGIQPGEIEKVVGRRSSVDIPEDQTLFWEMF